MIGVNIGLEDCPGTFSYGAHADIHLFLVRCLSAMMVFDKYIY